MSSASVSGSTSENGNTEAPAWRPMPRNADEMTAEWLTAALQSHGRDVVVRSPYDATRSARALAR